MYGGAEVSIILDGKRLNSGSPEVTENEYALDVKVLRRVWRGMEKEG